MKYNSASAPAVGDNVGQPYNNFNSRGTPQHTSGNGVFFEEGPGDQNGILGSLLLDNKPRTPFDLIQQDFPSTESSIFASRLLAVAEQPGQQQTLANGQQPQGHPQQPRQGQQIYHPQARHAGQDGHGDPNGLDRAMQGMYVSQQQSQSVPPPNQQQRPSSQQQPSPGPPPQQQQYMPQYVAVDGQQPYYVQPAQYQQSVVGANGQPVYIRVEGNQTYPHDQIVYAPAPVNSGAPPNRMTYAQQASQNINYSQQPQAWGNPQEVDPRRVVYPAGASQPVMHAVPPHVQQPAPRNYSQMVQTTAPPVQQMPPGQNGNSSQQQYDRSDHHDRDRRDDQHGRGSGHHRDSRDNHRGNDRDSRDRRDNNRGNDRGGGRNDRDDRGGRGGLNNSNNSNNSSNNNNGSTSTGPRDPVVEEFRSTYGKGGRQWEIRDLIGHVIPFCQDQHGSRFIQQKLEVANDTDKQTVFEEIIPQAVSLMTDVFGNYVIQKLFEYGTPEQCETLASLIMGQSVNLAMQMYGCRVIQKALEYVGTPRLIALVAEFDGQQVLSCVYDQNGNHVIQKCIEIVSRTARAASSQELADYLSSRIQFIITAFQGQVKELSKHPYGCRVVQRILEHCTNGQKASVLEELRKCCADLVQDQYGNYVIQHVMQHGWDPDRVILIREVQSHLLDFSQHKFASNVVEKCLQYANKVDRDAMIWGIINVTFDLNNPVDAKTGHCVLENMVRDPYANYVVQKVIDVSDEKQRGAIIRYVKDNIIQLRKYTYGKHIIVRLEKVSNEKF